MTDDEFKALGQDILDAIEFLKVRGYTVTAICELLEDAVTLTKRWKSITTHFQEADNSTVNVDMFKDAFSKLKNRVVATLLYDNKMVQILSPIDDTFNKLFNHYQSNLLTDIKECDFSDLTNMQEGLQFSFKIDDRYQAFGTKTIVEDKVKEHIESEVSQDIQDEYSVIYGIKTIQIPAIMIVVFDTIDKQIIVGMDLANIIHPSKVSAELSKLSVEVKRSTQELNFSQSPVNLFDKIKAFHDDSKVGKAFDMSFKTMNDGMVHHIHANSAHPDARTNNYHKKGKEGINNTLVFFRIHMNYKTIRNTDYSIDLKSYASMTTKKDPVLYSAIISSKNAQDFSEALSRLK